MAKGSRGGLEFWGRLLVAAREKGEFSRGPREAHPEHQYSAIKSCSGRADEKGGTEEGPRRDRGGQESPSEPACSSFLLTFSALFSQKPLWLGAARLGWCISKRYLGGGSCSWGSRADPALEGM